MFQNQTSNQNSMMRILTITCLIFMQIACSHNPLVTSKQPGNSNLVDLSSLTAFAGNFGSLKVDEQKGIREALLQKFTASPDDWQTKLKIALIYALPSSVYQQKEKAEALFSEMNTDTRLTGEATALISLIRGFLAETARTEQLLSESQKRNAQLQLKGDSVKLKIDQLQQRNDALQSQNRLLEQKLEALKKIEQTMGNRNRRLN